MPPGGMQQRFGGTPNNIASHYQQYSTHSAGHSAGLPPPALGNPGFLNPSAMSNAFSNGNSLGGLGASFGGSALGMPGGTGLASQAAQMSFATANMHQGHNGMNEGGQRASQNKNRIREVWAGNLQEEMALIRSLVDRFPYIAMDTEFPGLVARPMGSFNGKSDYHYQCLRCNVDLLKIIQIGLTMFNEQGETLPQAPISARDICLDTTQDETRKFAGQMLQLPTTWQFNFKFSLEEDMYSEPAMRSMTDGGTNFEKHRDEGIDPFDFGALLMSSGLVCDEDVRWMSFHSAYDFGYLTKLLMLLPLPDDEAKFGEIMKKFFPSIYDIKYLMKHAIRQHQMGQLTPLEPSNAELLAKFEQKSTLENLAESLKQKRSGGLHQAGPDSLLTGKVFFKMRERVFNGEIGDEYLGCLWGLGLPGADGVATQSTPQHYNQQENIAPNGHANDTPSTPDSRSVRMSETPSHANGGPSTPGGVFGAFQYSSR